MSCNRGAFDTFNTLSNEVIENEILANNFSNNSNIDIESFIRGFRRGFECGFIAGRRSRRCNLF
jgi:hypothetical protein